MVNQEVLLSVIVPNYNKGKYIKHCIKSILDQSYAFFELLIVDDCSSDDSRQIINEMKNQDPRIRIFFLPENKGVSNARNVGLQNAKGEYITFIDSDDIYLNADKLKNEMNIIRIFKMKGKDVIAYSQDLNIDINGNVVGWKCPGFLMPRSEILTDAISGFRASRAPRDYIVKKDVIDSVGGYSYPINYFEDLDLRIRLSMVTKFVYTYKIGTGYRLVGDGLSSGYTWNDAKNASDSIRKKYYPKLPFYKKIIVFFKKILRYMLFYISMFVRRVKSYD